MTREVDVNSGAAPQPGGWAGAEGAARGHALPGSDTEVEQVQALNEAPDVSGPKSVQDIVGISESDNFPGEEQEAVNQASLEHSAIDPSEDEDTSDEDDDDAKPAKKAAKKTTKKKS